MFAIAVAFIFVLPAVVVTLIKFDASTYFKMINHPVYAGLWGAISFIGLFLMASIQETK
jgi:hypothetical protein